MSSAPPEHAEKRPDAFSSLIGHIAGTIRSENYPNADRAILKRMDLEREPPLAFYRFAFRHLPENWSTDRRGWSAILQGMALMHPRIHQPSHPFGKALAEQGYQETRLERLLAADGLSGRTLLLRAIRFLAARKIAADWRDIARLLLTRDTEKREQIHMKIATDYYRNLKTKE